MYWNEFSKEKPKHKALIWFTRVEGITQLGTWENDGWVRISDDDVFTLDEIFCWQYAEPQSIDNDGKKEWYNAGMMAQRILNMDEIENLKKKLNEVTTNYAKSALACDDLQKQNAELTNRCIAIEDRIKILMAKDE